MFRNILFITLYIVLYDIAPPEYMLYALFLQSIIALIDIVSSNKTIINTNTMFYIYLIYTSLANINIIHVAGTVENVTYSYIITEYINDATLIFCLGSVFITIGMELISVKSLPSIAFEISKRQAKNLFFVILIMSNYFTYIFFNLIIFGTVSKILLLSGQFGIIFYSRIWINENDKTYRNYTLILYFVSTIMALLYSYLRIEIILPTFVLLIALIISYNNLNILFSYKIIPFILIFILFSLVFNELGKQRGNKTSYDTISNFIGQKFTPETTTNQIIDDEDTAKGSLFQRTSNLAPITQVIKLTKVKGFYNGSVSNVLIIALIPRIFWPEKPLIELGSWFALETGLGYKSDAANARSNNSINMTIYGQLYLDFGWIGVILGCLLIGIFVSLLWNSTGFNDSNYNFSGAIYGGYLIFLAFTGIGADCQIIITFLSTYLLFYIIKYIYENTNRRPALERE